MVIKKNDRLTRYDRRSVPQKGSPPLPPTPLLPADGRYAPTKISLDIPNW